YTTGAATIPVRCHSPHVMSAWFLQLFGCASSWHGPPEFGARGEFHLEGRAIPERRFDPNAAAVHLDDLPGACEPQTGPALGLGVGTVDLVEPLKDAGLVLFGNAWPSIGHADVEVAVDRLGTHAYLARVGELDGVADEVE